MQDVVERYTSMLAILGKVALATLFPDDMESHVISLELTTWNNTTLEYFTFPINPSVLTQIEKPLVNVKKTFGGVSVTSNSSLNPYDLNISGNFGKKFKFLLGRRSEGFYSILNYSRTQSPISNTTEFSKFVKTGYGAVKLLKNLIDMSYQTDDNMPRKLYLHNGSFGSSYLIKVLSKKFDIRANSNIWEYSLEVKIIAPVKLLVSDPKRDRRSLTKSFAIGTVMNIVNNDLKYIRKFGR